MRSSSVSVVTTPGAASAQSWLRAKTTGAAFPASASACGCSMFADAKTSAASPFSIRSRRSPDAPKSRRPSPPLAA